MPKERFVLRKAVSGMHPPPMFRIPGQVPTKEAIEAMQLVTKPAPKFNVAMLERQGGAYLSPSSVVSGLGLEKGQESSWIKFLETNLRAPNAMVLRKAVMDRARDEKLDPGLRRAILERSLRAYVDMRKSMVEIATPDELLKGEARGGRYFKRTETASGRKRYFYDEESYNRSKGAHINGEDAARSAIRGGIQKAIEANGKDGCDLKTLKPLVKRYGSKMVASVLDEDVKKSKKLKFNKGKLYASTQE